MKKIVFLGFIFLTGCSSDIDKCVQAGMRAWDEAPHADETRAKAEARWRIGCLRAASKGD